MKYTGDSLIPDECSSDGQYRRYYHFDIADSDDSQLQEELWALHPHLWGLPTEHWLRKRCKALEVELRKRQIREFEKKTIEAVPKAEGVKL